MPCDGRNVAAMTTVEVDFRADLPGPGPTVTVVRQDVGIEKKLRAQSRYKLRSDTKARCVLTLYSAKSASRGSSLNGLAAFFFGLDLMARRGAAAV